MKINKKILRKIMIVSFILTLVFAFIYFNNVSSKPLSIVAVYKDCNEAKNTYTYGADVGECFVYTSNNFRRVRFVKSVNEKYPVQGTFCNIETTENNVYVFTCDYAYKSDGTTVQVCKSDSDCPSLNCVNWMCKPYSSDCSNVGDTKCSSREKYQQCLLSKKWSGLLQCPSGTECLYNACESVICNIGDTKCVNTVLYECNDGYSWKNKGNSNICNPGNVPDLLSAQPYNPLSCVSNWECTQWSDCMNNKQNRNCDDLNNCLGRTPPLEIKSCNSYVCDSNWECTEWSECSHFKQTRICIDSNNCQDKSLKPTEEQVCEDNLDPFSIGSNCGQGLNQCSDGSCKVDCNEGEVWKTMAISGGIASGIALLISLFFNFLRRPIIGL